MVLLIYWQCILFTFATRFDMMMFWCLNGFWAGQHAVFNIVQLSHWYFIRNISKLFKIIIYGGGYRIDNLNRSKFPLIFKFEYARKLRLELRLIFLTLPRKIVFLVSKQNEYIQQLYTPYVIMADKINMESCQLVREPSAGRYVVSPYQPYKTVALYSLCCVKTNLFYKGFLQSQLFTYSHTLFSNSHAVTFL